MARRSLKNGSIPTEAIKEKMRAAKAEGQRVHVMSHHKGWAVIREGASKATKLFADKPDAVDCAREFILKGTAKEIIVHHKDGSIECQESASTLHV